MAEQWEWGPGEKAKTEPAFDTGVMRSGETFELVNGEHPHGRNYNNHYARFANGRIEAFEGHRPRIDVSLESYNYLKTSGISGDEIRKGGDCRISFDGVVVSSFFFRDAQHALLRAHRLIDDLLEFGVQFWRGEKLVGAAIWYEGHPCVIDRFDAESGEIFIVPEPGTGTIPCPANWRVTDLRESWPDYENGLRSELLNPAIKWFREQDQ